MAKILNKKIASNYGREEWSSGVFLAGCTLIEWLEGAILWFDTADRADQKLKAELSQLSKCLAKVLRPPAKRIAESGQQPILEEMVGKHHEIIYRVIGLNDDVKADMVLKFIKGITNEPDMPAEYERFDKVFLDWFAELKRIFSTETGRPQINLNFTPETVIEYYQEGLTPLETYNRYWM
jgi:hypothetical protein